MTDKEALQLIRKSITDTLDAADYSGGDDYERANRLGQAWAHARGALTYLNIFEAMQVEQDA